jgi:EAL domain-containing protein (putative c-di-GMP-specific phosphodiesterase class I)
LHYQPQVHVRTGKLAGVEALVRWPHPAHGMVGPGDIIPLVEQAGLHLEFDRWVVGAICLQAKTWKKAKIEVPLIAANIWAQTLRHTDALKLMEALAQTGADPRQIELECPRGSSADSVLTRTLVRIRALGVRLASEDYAGAARPSGKLRFDTLKIPFPLSRDHATSPDAIRSVVAEARAIGARVVADSVETPAQEEALLALGVEIVQGYLYGPEVAPGELKTLITRPGA